jgi:hypothetical protein
VINLAKAFILAALFFTFSYLLTLMFPNNGELAIAFFYVAVLFCYLTIEENNKNEN